MREKVDMSQFQDQHSADRVHLVVIYKYIRNKAYERYTMKKPVSKHKWYQIIPFVFIMLLALETASDANDFNKFIRI